MKYYEIIKSVILSLHSFRPPPLSPSRSVSAPQTNGQLSARSSSTYWGHQRQRYLQIFALLWLCANSAGAALPGCRAGRLYFGTTNNRLVHYHKPQVACHLHLLLLPRCQVQPERKRSFFVQRESILWRRAKSHGLSPNMTNSFGPFFPFIGWNFVMRISWLSWHRSCL